MTRIGPLLAVFFFGALVSAVAQQSQPGGPQANPGRPTVSTPATLTPVGYLQFETGLLSAWRSPGLSSQSSINEVVKFSVARHLQLLVATQPYAYSRAENEPANGMGDVDVGFQTMVHQGEGAQPTIAFSYLGQVHNGDAPDLDVGSFRNSALLLVSADVKGFHYDTNYLFNEVVNGSIRRLQFGQTLSVSHDLAGKFGISGEIWRFTQPFLQSNTIGNLWALNYNARPNLVFDGGFNRGLTGTATRWELFAGFTYLLPHKFFRPKTRSSSEL
ncbi:MAG: hypothetical protein ACRD8A_15895 [Candidatus Acidiferrales bacterium]